MTKKSDLIKHKKQAEAHVVHLPAPVSEAVSVFQMIERAQRDKSVDVTKLERLFDLYERAKHREAEEAYNQAVELVRGKMPRIVKNKAVLYEVEKGKPDKGTKEAFKYATLEKIDEIVAPLLKEAHLRPSFTTKHRENGAIVVGKLTHVLGHSEECEIPLPLDTSGGKNNVQAMGSTFSYGQRYTLCGLLNIVVVGADDDGQASTTLSPEQVKKLEDRLEKCGADKALFLQFMEANSMESILLSQLKKAENMIARKERAYEKEQNKPKTGE